MSTGTRSESAEPRPDGSHLDEDAECLEDPVHCGDARHQHDVHTHAAQAATTPAADAPDGSTSETAQA